MVSSGRPCGMAPDQLAGQHRADRAVDVAHRLDELDLLAALERRPRTSRSGCTSSALSRPWSCSSTWQRGTSAGTVGWWKMRLKSRPLRLPVRDALLRVEQVGAADQVVERADAELRHDLARFLGDEEEVVDDVLGLALRTCARSTGSCVATPTGQVFRWHLRIMMQPSTTSGAVAKPNSSAPSSAPIDDVAAGLHLAVGLHADAAAQAVQHQRLLRLGQAELPRRAGVLDRATTARRRCRRRGRRSRRGRPSPWRRRRRPCRRRPRTPA